MVPQRGEARRHLPRPALLLVPAPRRRLFSAVVSQPPGSLVRSYVVGTCHGEP